MFILIIKAAIIITTLRLIFTKDSFNKNKKFSNKIIPQMTDQRHLLVKRNLQNNIIDINKSLDSNQNSINVFNITNTINVSNSNNLIANITSSLLNLNDSNKANKPNLNIFADFFNSPEILIYYYNETFIDKKLKIKNKSKLSLQEKYISEISAPITITKNPAYLKLQATITKDYIDTSDCDYYQLKDFQFVSIKNCTFQIFDSNDIFLTNFNLILLTMKIEQISINQCLIEFSEKYEKENIDIKTNYYVSGFPNYLTEKILFTECKQSFCKDIEDRNITLAQAPIEPIYGQYNFQLNFLDLVNYEFELFRAFLIVRKEDYDIDTIHNNIDDYNMVYYYNSTSNINNIKKFNDTKNDSQSGNTISFFTDITKILQIKGNSYQINLDVFPETFDLKLIFDVQRINLDGNIKVNNSLSSDNIILNNITNSSNNEPGNSSINKINDKLYGKFEVLFS